MCAQFRFSVSVFSMRIFVRFLALGLGLCMPQSGLFGQATDQPIPATKAFDAPACSDTALGGLDIDFGVAIAHVPSPQRGNPEWKAIILDSTQPANLQPPKVLEGFVAPVANDETSSSQATSEVAEEDLPWTHYTHDFTFKVVPDTAYQGLLSSWARYPGSSFSNTSNLPMFEFNLVCSSVGGSVNGTSTAATCTVPPETCPDGTMGTTCQHTDMEVEWDSASLMDEHEGFQRDWGAVPEFVWPTVNDRVWVSGRWIFDCGHPGTPSADANGTRYVKFSTEVHPPRAIVTYRLNHESLDSYPVSRTSAPNFPFPQSYLPVTGAPVDPATLPQGVPNSGPTNVPVTEADIFVSVNGGAASDICSITSAPCSGHTGPIIPANDRNYVFDIYPPITDYGFPETNGTFKVFPPTPDASLQWRVVDHSTELPLRACGTADGSGCVTVDPIICLVDSSTKPPDQTETSCPTLNGRPTRLRVILPFCGTNSTAQSPGGCTNTTNPNYFAKSILVGWDDVPDPAGHATPTVRTFQVRLHDLTVKDNGSGSFTNSDWRVFVNVGGQYRYMSRIFDAKGDGTSVCNGADPLPNNGNNDCYLFEGTPWTVSVEDGTPIHVAVGGFIARGVEDPDSSLYMCRNADLNGGCNAPQDFDPLDNPFRAFAFSNDDRIGTYEFDLKAPSYIAPNPFTTAQFGCSVISITGCSLRYQVAFNVQETPAATAPLSGAVGIGTPNFGQFVSSATPLTLTTASADAEGFQYRSYLQGGTLPTYPFLPPQPYPVHWTHADLSAGSQSVPVGLSGADGPYFLQYSAESFGQLLEPRHTATLTLDNTPPVISIGQPQATAYPHSAMLTLSYSVDDGTGSGVASFRPTMDGATTLPGPLGLQSGQVINLLMELTLGAHTFSIIATDNVNNTGTTSVTFTIIVTPDSIKGDVSQFLGAGKIKNNGEANSLLAKLNAAANARAAGNCATANNIYQAFINELNAQSGKGVDAVAAAIMIGDAQYLMAHCP